VTLCLIECSK